MSVRADRPATGRGRLTLLPGLCRLWRDETALQLGADPARAVIIDLPDQRTARVLDLLDGSRTEHAVLRDARAMDIPADVTRALLAALRAANLVIGADMLMPPSLPEGIRRRLLTEAVARALAARTLDLPPSGWIFRDEPDDPDPASHPDLGPGRPDDPAASPTSAANPVGAANAPIAPDPTKQASAAGGAELASPEDAAGRTNAANPANTAGAERAVSRADGASPRDATDLTNATNPAARAGMADSAHAASPTQPIKRPDLSGLPGRPHATSPLNPANPADPRDPTRRADAAKQAEMASSEGTAGVANPTDLASSVDPGSPTRPARAAGSDSRAGVRTPAQDSADTSVGGAVAGDGAVGRADGDANGSAGRSGRGPKAKRPPIAPAEALRRRAAAAVQVVGASRLVVPIACTLARAGVGHVDPALTGRVEVHDEAIGGLTPADADRPRATAASEAVLRVAPYTDTRALRAGTATFVVQVGQGVPAELAAYAYARRALPHLLIEERDDTVLIGPLVPPHGSPCLRCLDLHRRDRDPAWPTLIAQLATTGDGGSTVATTTTIIAVGVAAAQVLGYIDGDEVPTIGASIEVGPPSTLRRRSWSAHPRCECAHRVRGVAPGRPSRRPGPRRM